MRKLKHFRPKLITDTFFPNTDPYDINGGQCFKWAYLAFHTFSGLQLWDHPCHAFVQYHGRFYDSERLRGVIRWTTLPAVYNTTWLNGDWGARRLSVSAFEDKWNACGGRWKKWRQQARELVRSQKVG